MPPLYIIFALVNQSKQTNMYPIFTFQTIPFSVKGITASTNQSYVDLALKIYPQGDIFNKTYYKWLNGELVAFRILAWYYYRNHPTKVIRYLVQLPNQEPKWYDNFVTGTIYTSAEDFINAKAKGCKVESAIKIGSLSHLEHDSRYSKYVRQFCSEVRLEFRETYFSKDDIIYKALSDINYFGATSEGFFIGISHSNSSYREGVPLYETREECAAKLLNGLKVKDFAEDPFTIKLDILPNKAKEWTLRLTE